MVVLVNFLNKQAPKFYLECIESYYLQITRMLYFIVNKHFPQFRISTNIRRCKEIKIALPTIIECFVPLVFLFFQFSYKCFHMRCPILAIFLKPMQCEVYVCVGGGEGRKWQLSNGTTNDIHIAHATSKSLRKCHEFRESDVRRRHVLPMLIEKVRVFSSTNRSCEDGSCIEKLEAVQRTHWKAAAENVRWPTVEREKGGNIGGNTREHQRKELWPRYEIARFFSC